ncbi:MAG: M23 family metallopeptidase [Candidatus Kapabacteria bacterium]|nr:M23 family metallopeptidase [Candidatus Kapabacteria bacterium]
MKYLLPAILLCVVLALWGCSDNNATNPSPDNSSKIQVIKNDIPFPTEKYIRIPYSLKLWEFEKEGLKLVSIQVIDDVSKKELIKLEGENLPKIYKSPLSPTNLFQQDEIKSYYLSIQLPILLTETKPSKISHILTLRDTIKNEIIHVEGGSLTPRFSEIPIVISSPVKGENWLFINQSTNEYHFYVTFFTEGKLYNAERFAFDNLQLNPQMEDYFIGDPAKNESYFNYGDTLYAVADGKVLTITDGRPENNGNMQNIKFNNLDEYAGNYLILDIGGGKKAFYAHCQPNSFLVSQGANVKVGDPIAILGNSGNSTAPHLHFHIFDGTDILLSYGVPFVLKEYTKVAEWNDKAVIVPKEVIHNSMMEASAIINFEK